MLAQDHHSKRPAVLAICGAVRHSRGRYSGHCQVLHDDKLPRGLGPFLYIHFWLLCSAHAAALKAANSDSPKAAKTHAPPAFSALFRRPDCGPYEEKEAQSSSQANGTTVLVNG